MAKWRMTLIAETLDGQPMGQTKWFADEPLREWLEIAQAASAALEDGRLPRDTGESTRVSYMAEFMEPPVRLTMHIGSNKENENEEN
jgi:hypothetical protein